MVKIIGKIYFAVVEIFLWLIPIAGGVLGNFFAEEYYMDSSTLVVLGVLAGIIIDLLFFGPVVILLNIMSSLKNIESKMP
jgi:hypothetical protein